MHLKRAVAMDTPKKRVKPNERSTLEGSHEHETVKRSIMSKLLCGHLGRKDSEMFHNSMVSEFDLPVEYVPSRASVESMEEEEGEEVKELDLVLGRKLTCFQRESVEGSLNTLSLYRSNSNVDQRREIQQIRLGDNIYLKSINHPEQRAARAKCSNEGEGSRINKDYEIEKKLRRHGKHHGNYICLNKLERIFYYIKKVSISFDTHENYEFIQRLISQQIRIYNKDSRGHLLRFNQSWFQQSAVYLTFEVAAESLMDTLIHKKLRETQVWDCVRDCAKTLRWMHEEEVSHLNIKPGNILKCHGRFKLSDPYLSSDFLDTYLKKEEKQWDGWLYLAPQLRKFRSLIQGLNLSQCDVYSLGMCLLEGMLGEQYFPREGKAMRTYLQKHLHGYSPLCVKTVMRMVSTNPSKRPTPSELSEFGYKQEKPAMVRRNSI